MTGTIHGAPPLERMSTGDPGLDLVLGGGLPRGSAVVVSGPPGAGKSILAQQLAFTAASADAPALLVSTLSESQDKLVRHLAGLEFFDEDRWGRDIIPISVQDSLGASGLHGATSQLLAEVVRRRPALVVIDSAKALVDDGTEEGIDSRRALYELVASVGRTGATLVLVGEYETKDLRQRAEFAVADAILELGNELESSFDRRSLHVAKLRGSGFLGGRHALTISAEGIHVHPRLESVVPTAETVHAGRASTGVAALDEALGGGLPVGDATVLLGPSGAGKTVLALHLAAEGIARGEQVLYVSLEESPDALRAKWRSFGMSLDEADTDGLLDLFHAPITELDIDWFGSEVMRRIEATSPTRVIVDSLGEIIVGAERDGRYPGFLWALSNACRSAGASVLFTQEVRALGPSGVGAGVSHLFHNVLLLRYVEDEGQLRRGLSVMKMRDSAHAAGLLGLTISSDGMTVDGPLRDATGLLGWSALAAGSHPPA